MINISDKPKHWMFIKIPLLQPVSPSGAQVPIANSNKTPAGTFHQLLPFPERKHPSFTSSLYLLLNFLHQSVPNCKWKPVIGLNQLPFLNTTSSFSALPLPGFLTVGKAQERWYFLGFPIRSTILLQSSVLLINYTFCPLWTPSVKTKMKP